MNDVKRKSNLKVIVWLLTLMLMFVGNVYYMTPTVKAETTVYVTKTGSKYHTHKCGNGVYYAATLSQATARGLTACEKCYGGSNGGTSAGGTSNSDSSDTAGAPPAVSENVVIKPIKISKTSIVLLKGKTSKLTIANTTEEIIWESSKKSVAEVSSSGKVTAKKKGKAVITATVGNQKKTCQVTVEEPKLSKKNLTMNPGHTYKISLSGCKHSVKWSSGNSSVAKVSNGKITAKKPGKTTITAKVHNQKYKCVVKVNKPKVKNVSLGQTNVQLEYNKSIKLKVSAAPKNALKYYDISVKSSNENIVNASVGYDGASIILNAGENSGSCKVVVTVGNVTTELKVNVIPPVISSISLNKPEMTLRPDRTGRLSVTVNPSEAVNYYDIEWKSSDTSVVKAEYDYGNYGEVTAVGEGEADVTVKMGTATATCHVVVIRPEITEVTLNKPEMTLKPGGTGRLSVTVNPSEE